MKRFCLALLFLVSSISDAAEIYVGSVPLVIPNPSGFSPVTPQMVLLHDLKKQFVAPTNVEFATFIPDEHVPAVLKDDIPELPRRFTVQTAKDLAGASVSSSDFIRLKNVIKSQNDEIMRKVEAQMPGLLKSVNEGLIENHDLDLDLAISQMVPMPAHEETDRTLAYSALVNFQVNNENGNREPLVVAITTTLVHVKGKVLFLYSYAEAPGLEWSRDAARQWAGAIVAANPSDLQASVKEMSPFATSGVNWASVTATGVAGAFLGLIAGLIGWAVKRRKRG